MRMNRFVALFLSLVAVVCTVGSIFYWRLDHSFSFAIHWRGDRVCQGRQPCVFTLAQVFPGDWDQIFVFTMNASQQEINTVVGERVVRPDLQRLIVFTKAGSIVRTMTDSQSFERPSGGEVTFDGVPFTDNHYILPRNGMFVKAHGEHGTEVLALLKPGQV